ncbi:MAG: CoA pyrophosphatase [Chloroflexaceae bacterium]|nr:CoA pyrophosphatase [Chloroflexaceae bacterium]
MTWKYQREQIQQALGDARPVNRDDLLLPRDRSGQFTRKMAPPAGVIPREAAVLLLLYPRHDELCFPLTVRNTSLPQHAGEVSLPGGAVDPDDGNPINTALRETAEELGVDIAGITIWGQLSAIYIPVSNFSLTTVVGFLPAPPILCPNPHEIAEVFEAPLSRLLQPDCVITEEWQLGGQPVMVPFFALNGYKVWGATAILLSELVVRLRRMTQTAQ